MYDDGVCGAYRTVSNEALSVVAGIVPIDLLVEERIRVWEKKKMIVVFGNRDGMRV